MKTTFALSALLPLLAALPAAADTFTLKDGTTLEGTVISETPDSYLLNVIVGKGIKDEKKVAKADVMKVEKEEPDAKAFLAFAKYVPTPDLMTADEYGAKISALEGFLKTYPHESKSKEAKTMLETLKAEANHIAAGAVKLNGKMVYPADSEPNAFEFDAQVSAAKIRAMITQGQTLAALRAFAAFDKDYHNTQASMQLAPTIKTLMQNHVAAARQQLMTVDDRIKERQAGLTRMTGDDRRTTEAAIAEENAAVDAQFKAEKTANLGWVTPSPYHKASLDETVKFGDKEIERVSAAKPPQDGGAAFRETYGLIQSGGTPQAISTSMNAAKAAGVSQRYLTVLDNKAKERAKSTKPH